MTACIRKAVEMGGAKRFDVARRRTGFRVVVTCLATLIGIAAFSSAPEAQSVQQRSFPSPEEAVKVLIDTVKKGDVDALFTIFGQEGKDLLASSDLATARLNRQVFAVAAAEQWRLTDAGDNRKTLIIGNEDWPFPVPIVREANLWRFDTAAGTEEVIARRIGRNELAVIDTVRAYVTAQQRYAAEGHDGNAPGAYAARFQSEPGKENGLYWPTAQGQKRSPLGDLVAQAAAGGRTLGGDAAKPSPFHGYYFRILTGQGPAASGGSKPYIVKGRMSAGFALVAWPAQYDATGVTTFLVNQDGIVLEKDLGQGTDAAARAMTLYNPDPSWRRVE